MPMNPQSFPARLAFAVAYPFRIAGWALGRFWNAMRGRPNGDAP